MTRHQSPSTEEAGAPGAYSTGAAAQRLSLTPRSPRTWHRAAAAAIVACVGALGTFCTPNAQPPGLGDQPPSPSGADGGYVGSRVAGDSGGADVATDGNLLGDGGRMADGGQPADGSQPSDAMGSGFTGFDVVQVPPVPQDASYNPTPPDSGSRGGGDSTVCRQQLAWWTSGAMLDATVSPSAAASMNSLLSAQHPLTLADYVDSNGAYWLDVSGTETNGVQQQYFPYQNSPNPAALAISTDTYPQLTGTSPAGEPSTGWIRLIDSSGSEVWIPMVQVATTVTAGDSLCQSLTNGQLTAVVPFTAAGTTLVLSGAATTVGQVFGNTTATSPSGWNIVITFTASKVQVTLK
jgi:hypothetical protein